MARRERRIRSAALATKTVSIVIAIAIVRTGSDINAGSYVRTNVSAPASDASASAIGTTGPVKPRWAAARPAAANVLYW